MAKVNEALGMIETKGFIALLEATDAMLKAAPRHPSTWAGMAWRCGKVIA